MRTQSIVETKYLNIEVDRSGRERRLLRSYYVCSGSRISHDSLRISNPGKSGSERRSLYILLTTRESGRHCRSNQKISRSRPASVFASEGVKYHFPANRVR